MRRLALVIPFLCVGCVSTTFNTVKTEIFENDLERLIAEFNKLEPDKTTRDDIIKAGFRPDAPNLDYLDGPEAMQTLFGEQAFQAALRDTEKLKAILKDMNRYHMIKIPYVDVTTDADRFYWSRKDTHTFGVKATITFIFEGDGTGKDVLIFRSKKYRKIDEKKTEYAFAQGFLDLVEKISGISGPVGDLSDSIKGIIERQQNKD